MALYKTPKSAIIGAIKALNGVTLIESEYVFGLPVAAVGADGICFCKATISAIGLTIKFIV